MCSWSVAWAVVLSVAVPGVSVVLAGGGVVSSVVILTVVVVSRVVNAGSIKSVLANSIG